MPTVEAEIKAVGQWITDLTKTGIPPHEIAIFVRSDAELGRAKAAANAAALSFDVLDENVTTPIGRLSISTMHLAKGLEFRAVAVMACPRPSTRDKHLSSIGILGRFGTLMAKGRTLNID